MTDSKTSWVHTNHPPGWDVRPSLSGAAWYVERCSRDAYVVTADGTSDGDPVWSPSRSDACRLAWERWSVEVLGPVGWTYGPEHAPELATRSRYVTARGGHCWVYCCRGTYAVVYDAVEDEADVTCTDPVEALARLAALVLALEGPG